MTVLPGFELFVRGIIHSLLCPLLSLCGLLAFSLSESYQLINRVLNFRAGPFSNLFLYSQSHCTFFLRHFFLLLGPEVILLVPDALFLFYLLCFDLNSTWNCFCSFLFKFNIYTDQGAGHKCAVRGVMGN